jgi:hypothetical protein
MNIEFVATVAVIAPGRARSHQWYADDLGLPLLGERDGYSHSETVAGCKSFGIWPLAQAARACFGTGQWPAERLVPQASIEFDVRSPGAVAQAARELVDAGHDLLHDARQEPWGQTVARLQSPEGLIIGIAYTPVFHEKMTVTDE